MSDLTPETALAMAHAGAHNEPEHYCRYPSSVTVPAEQMAAEVIRRLLILGFEVRRKDGPAHCQNGHPMYCFLPCARRIGKAAEGKR